MKESQEEEDQDQKEEYRDKEKDKDQKEKDKVTFKMEELYSNNMISEINNSVLWVFIRVNRSRDHSNVERNSDWYLDEVRELVSSASSGSHPIN